MTNEKYEKKFVLQIGKKIIFGIYRKEVIVYKTVIKFFKDEDEI
jgi:hypothetical protein